MGKISEKRRSRIATLMQAATWKFGAQVMVSLHDERERLSIFVIRPDGGKRMFVANSKPSSINTACYAAGQFALPY